MKTLHIKQLHDEHLEMVCGGDKGGIPNVDPSFMFERVGNALVKSNFKAFGSLTTGLCNAVTKNAHNIICIV